MWSQTIDDVLIDHKGVGPGFDFLRVFLSLFIFIIHCHYLSEPRPGTGIGVLSDTMIVTKSLEHSYADWSFFYYVKRGFRIALVPMFFALSGFLVAASAFRLRSISLFLSFRVIRILPALAMEITLSALVLGPLVTSMKLGEYYTDPLFIKYFLNIPGIVQLQLPGVFINHISSIVNAGLWTLPAEFYCYLLLSISILTGVLKSQKATLALFLAFTILMISLSVFGDTYNTSGLIYDRPVIVYYFFCGVILFMLRDKFPYSSAAFLCSLLIGSLSICFPKGVFLAPMFVTYCTVAIGLAKMPSIPIFRRGDYSYGIYLYGWPITQAVVSFFPNVLGHRYKLLVVSGVVTMLFSVMSWHFVERPTLKLKRNVAKIFDGRAKKRFIPIDPDMRESA